MKKKNTAILLAAAASMLLLGACGADTEQNSQPEVKQETEIAEETSKASAEETSDEAAEETETAAKKAATTAAAEDEKANVTETSAESSEPDSEEESSEQDTDSDSADDSPAEQQTEAPEQPSDTEQYLLDELKLGQDCVAYLSKHTDCQTEKAPSCLGSGEDRVYTYPDFQLFTYYENGKEELREILITGGSFETRKGIRVGSSTADVTAAYGEPAEAGFYTYDTEDGKLQFFFDSDHVFQIDYLIQA